jgi:hypothetical protein
MYFYVGGLSLLGELSIDGLSEYKVRYLRASAFIFRLEKVFKA